MNQQPTFIVKDEIIWDSNPALLTGQQLRNEQQLIIKHLQDSGVLSEIPNIKPVHIKESLVQFFNGAFLMDNIEIKSLDQFFVQKETILCNWNILMNKNDLESMRRRETEISIKKVTLLDCSFCNATGFIEMLQQNAFNCYKCHRAIREKFCYFGSIRCSYCGCYQVLKGESFRKKLSPCESCKGIGIMNNINLEKRVQVLSKNVPVISGDEQKTKNLLMLIEKAEGKLLFERYRYVEAQVPDGYKIFKSRLHNVPVIEAKCMIASSLKSFWIVGGKLDVICG